MRILFIGGAGNISAECAALLHERGHDISVLSRGREALPPHYRALKADRKDAAAMQSALTGENPEVVINFLGYDLADVQLDYRLFNGQVRQYIFISSATVYAKPPRQLPLTEESPVGNPFWDYAQQKLACEEWLRQQKNFPVTIVRPSHTYSKRWIPNMVSSAGYSFAARLERGRPVFVHDDGETPWTLTAASDFAIGLGGLAGNESALGETFHITSDEVLTWNEIVAEIAAALKVKPPDVVRIPTDFICQVVPQLTGTLKGDKAHAGVFDNSKIKRFVPEYQCRRPFRLGIRESIEWLRAHPDQQHLNPQVDETIDLVISKWLRQ